MKRYCAFCGKVLEHEGEICSKCGNEIRGNGAVALRRPEKKLQIKKCKTNK